MAETKTEPKYNKIFKTDNEKAYDEASSYLGLASHHMRVINNKLHYFLIEKKHK